MNTFTFRTNLPEIAEKLGLFTVWSDDPKHGFGHGITKDDALCDWVKANELCLFRKELPRFAPRP